MAANTKTTSALSSIETFLLSIKFGEPDWTQINNIIILSLMIVGILYYMQGTHQLPENEQVYTTNDKVIDLTHEDTTSVTSSSVATSLSTSSATTTSSHDSAGTPSREATPSKVSNASSSTPRRASSRKSTPKRVTQNRDSENKNEEDDDENVVTTPSGKRVRIKAEKGVDLAATSTTPLRSSRREKFGSIDSPSGRRSARFTNKKKTLEH